MNRGITLLVYTLIEQNGKTDLEIIQEDNRPNAVHAEVQGEGNSILKMLKEIAETN
ncbi:hypothetical protein [Pedobacter sp. ok626]|uniref:hypothetical protein n=1 Tax=Pedobacter sp. ok626 TaxID=1761882 RepID=UPI00140538EB|nr:hypothetical protein [Pedobacter sp. ok626]